MPIRKTWNWQQPDWPNFRYDSSQLAALEAEFLRQSGIFTGALRHLGNEARQQLVIELISDEALGTSEIEGEFLNRDSLQSSIRRHFGLDTDSRKIPPAEHGIAQMMVELYRHFSLPLCDQTLFQWHEMIRNGRRDLKDIGRYRTGKEPMQVVSGALHEPKVHFEAPPAGQLSNEMERFVTWFNHTAPGGEAPLPVLTRAGIAHLFFVSIHPFEDGNGRIGRAICEKSISQGLAQGCLVALSATINSKRKTYYEMLEASNQQVEITQWLIYFSQTILTAQANALALLDFLIAKTKLYDSLRGKLNERQDKALARMLREGPGGFKGGLSARNYLSITGTSRATATRDLQELVELNALFSTGTLKGTRYHLALG